MNAFIVWGTVGIAVLLWGGFGFVVYTLQNDRAEYASAVSAFAAESLRDESANRLRAAVRDSVAERAALGTIISLSLLDTAETIESAGRDAGATNVAIGEATPIGKPVQNLTQYQFVVNASGSFVSLVRAVTLFESLSIPASVEKFEISKTEKTWHLVAHIRTTLSTP